MARITVIKAEVVPHEDGVHYRVAATATNGTVYVYSSAFEQEKDAARLARNTQAMNQIMSGSWHKSPISQKD